MATILRKGDEYDFSTKFESLTELPVQVYKLQEGMFGRLFLEEDDDFVLPMKIYHNDTDFIEHVITKYENDPQKGNLGMLLTGKKGLGKTFTAKIICRRLGLPVIKITNNSQTRIFDFLNKIDQPHIIFIDEFEKLFPDKSETGEMTQQEFLSFLDGNNSGTARKVFIITTNTSVNTYFINRPSRLTYVKNYDIIAQEVVVEVVNDLLKNPEFKDDLLDHLDYESLNIDILIKVIEEVNTMNKPYSKFKDFFNYSVEKVNFEFSIINPDDTLTPLGVNQMTELQFKTKCTPGHYVFMDDKGNYYNFVKFGKTTYDKWEVFTYRFDEDPNDLEKEIKIEAKLLVEKVFSGSIKYMF